MTPEQLAAIRGRLKAATPGKWHIKRTNGSAILMDVVTDMDNAGEEIVDSEIAENLYPHDAHFIANAPSDIAALLAEVERMKAGICSIPAGTTANDWMHAHDNMQVERDTLLAEVDQLRSTLESVVKKTCAQTLEIRQLKRSSAQGGRVFD